MALSSIRPRLALVRTSASKRETLYFSPEADSIKEGAGDADEDTLDSSTGSAGSGVEGDGDGDGECECSRGGGGAVCALAAPALVVTILSPSDSLDSSSADMEIAWLVNTDTQRCVEEYISSQLDAANLDDPLMGPTPHKPLDGA